MSDEDKLFALVLAMLVGGKTPGFAVVEDAKALLSQIKKAHK